MSRTVLTRTINAPVQVVFKTISNLEQFSQAVPGIVKVEILSEVKAGVGTRFRETRLMKGKEASTVLEVAEFVENDRIRMVADSHGTVWDSLFVVKPENGHTHLTLTMDAKTEKLIPKIINFMIGGMIKKAVAQDMDAVKAYCER